MEASWILHDTSHSGNVGSAARAIKTMEFYNLVLVNPRNPNATESEDAIALASGAEDVLKKGFNKARPRNSLWTVSTRFWSQFKRPRIRSPLYLYSGGLSISERSPVKQCSMRIFIWNRENRSE